MILFFLLTFVIIHIADMFLSWIREIMIDVRMRREEKAYADTIIPKSDIVFSPLETDVEFLSGGDEFVEVGDDGVAFGFGDTDDGGDEAGVEEDGFPVGDGVLGWWG